MISFDLSKQIHAELLQRSRFPTSKDIFSSATAPNAPRHPHYRRFKITHNDSPQSVGHPWTSDQPVAETSTWQHTTLKQTPVPPAGFEPAIPASERSHTHALDRAATGIGVSKDYVTENRGREVTILIHSNVSPETSGVPRNFFRGGFNKFSWGKRAERTGIWGW